MRVIRAEAMGLCFGVRDALALMDGVGDPTRVGIRGEMVHNPEVLRDLARRGFLSAPEGDPSAADARPVAVVTAHGISNRARAELAASGREILDATCPLVARAHRAALALAAEDRLVVVVGRAGHVEMKGLIGDLDRFEIVEAVEDVRCYGAARIGVLFQTTTPPDLARRVAAAVRTRNLRADVRVAWTVCAPTEERQRAVTDLAARVDAFVVVGGRTSNNTRQLERLARSTGRRALLVERAEEIDPAWFAGVRVVGLTAGTSTLDATVNEVERRLRAIARAA